jgi:ubiquitin-protein ligase
MLSEEDYWARLALEAKNIETEEPSFQPIQGDLRRWQGFVLGTGTYDGGVFVLQITVPRSFPYEPPQVRFITKIWHPNIYRGRVCVGVLGKDWLPSMSISGVVETLRNLLNFPNPDDPLNQQASREAKRNPDQFERTARDWVRRYAGWDQIQHR